MKKLYIFYRASFLLALLLQVCCYGQRTAANISGVVSDPAGAVIAGAHAVATDSETGTTTGAVANAQGFYVIANLSPGTYRLRVEAAGFQAVEQTGIVIQVGQSMTVNVDMKVGSQTEQVVVTTQPALVDTTSQTVELRDHPATDRTAAP